VRVSSFVSIGPAVWPAIRNKQTDKQTNITPFIIQIDVLVLTNINLENKITNLSLYTNMITLGTATAQM